MRSRWLNVSVLAVASGLILGGCSSVPKADYDEAVSENNALRDRLASLQDDLRLSEQEKSAFAQENAQLSGEVSTLRSRSSAAPAAGSFGASGGERSTDLIVTVAGDVLFNSGEATLRQEGQRRLAEVARSILSQYSGSVIRIEGYTDNDPIRRSKWRTNERLSAERAIVVEEYLVGRGIPSDQIYAAAMGSARPKTSKKDSRRVEIVILGAG